MRLSRWRVAKAAIRPRSGKTLNGLVICLLDAPSAQSRHPQVPETPMLSFLRRRSRFARTLEAYGLDRCSLSASGSQLWVGLPAHPDYDRAPLDAVPEKLKSVCFVEGPEQAGLVAAFVASAESRAVEFLMIGNSHDYKGSGEPGAFDVAPAVAALCDARLAALTTLSLGDMERLFNGHVYYGRVGDITHVFDIAPNLAELYVCGCPALARPVGHERLEMLQVRLDDIGVSGGPISQATLDAILASRFPRLRTLDLALDEEGAQPYGVPEAFFTDNGFPALQNLGMDWLKPEVEPRLRAWAASRAVRWTL
jgi:hypothetical protein